jgi:transcriptional regulator with XRE-family HTH domain
MSTQPQNAFGRTLRTARKLAGLSQSELAQRVGYSVQHISSLERGTRLPNIQHVQSAFVPALDLTSDPNLAQRLVQCAAQARGLRVTNGVRAAA